MDGKLTYKIGAAFAILFVLVLVSLQVLKPIWAMKPDPKDAGKKVLDQMFVVGYSAGLAAMFTAFYAFFALKHELSPMQKSAAVFVAVLGAVLLVLFFLRPKAFLMKKDGVEIDKLDMLKSGGLAAVVALLALYAEKAMGKKGGYLATSAEDYELESSGKKHYKMSFPMRGASCCE